MEYIVRKTYLDKIEEYADKPIIKVLTGMRRVGKSTILKMINEVTFKHIDNSNKICVNLESLNMISIRDAESLAKYIQDKIKDKEGKLYFFFDEVQLVDGWERVVNALQVDYDCDIYLTGSNSTMLSGKLATLIAGRYVHFEIYPFTFREYKLANSESVISDEELFMKYIELGGLPFVHQFNLEGEEAYQYLRDLYNTVFVKDVLEFNHIRDVDIFNRILAFTMENIGHTFSATSIRNYLKNEGRSVSVDTILNYLQFCIEAFIINKVPRYDAIGKRLLKIDEKYYLNDHGLRQAQGFSNVKDIERILENIVYSELRSEGCKVYIGKVGDKEIDFIAEKNGKKEYYQVCYALGNEETREREFRVLNLTPDNFPKYVLSLDKMDFSHDGIIHMNLVSWLLKDL